MWLSLTNQKAFTDNQNAYNYCVKPQNWGDSVAEPLKQNILWREFRADELWIIAEYNIEE